ncbi:MAG: hypothetical protein ACKVHL_02950 [Rhodospirillales bacterium]
MPGRRSVITRKWILLSTAPIQASCRYWLDILQACPADKALRVYNRDDRGIPYKYSKPPGAIESTIKLK